MNTVFNTDLRSYEQKHKTHKNLKYVLAPLAP